MTDALQLSLLLLLPLLLLLRPTLMTGALLIWGLGFRV